MNMKTFWACAAIYLTSSVISLALAWYALDAITALLS
jgi:hypothetical protein